jgi:hypothetical protein
MARPPCQNALEVSGLSSTLGILFFRIYTAALCTNLKLSWMVRVLMKAFWLGEMIYDSLGASLVASSLDVSLPKLWIIVIGR